MWILKQLHNAYPSFDLETTPVEFLFSIPTVWSPEIVEEFRRCIKNGGFNEKRHHKTQVTLTEAQAAALYTTLFPSSEPRTHPKQTYSVEVSFPASDYYTISSASS